MNTNSFWSAFPILHCSNFQRLFFKPCIIKHGTHVSFWRSIWNSSKFLFWPTGSVVMFLKYLGIIPGFATAYSEKHLWTESSSVQDTTMNKRGKGISNGACGKEWKVNFSYTGRSVIRQHESRTKPFSDYRHKTSEFEVTVSKLSFHL